MKDEPNPFEEVPEDVTPLQEAPTEEVQRAQEARLLQAWKTPEGWRYWSAVNNSEVGMWYTTVAFVFFLFGGVLALLMRLQLAVPGNDFLSADLYNQIFTLHGSIMMFLFAVPIFEAFSIFILPEMLGARDLPFPRLSAYGFWSFVLGGIFVCGSIFFDAAPRGGWFMYPPLTTTYQPGVGADIWLLGLTFIEVASIAAAVEIIVGILKTRPPGMRINLIRRCHPERGRRRRLPRRPLALRSRPDEPCLPRDGLGTGPLDHAPRGGRTAHAALLYGTPAGGAHDRTL